MSGVNSDSSPGLETTVEGDQGGAAVSTDDSTIDTDAPTQATQRVNEGGSRLLLLVPPLGAWKQALKAIVQVVQAPEI